MKQLLQNLKTGDTQLVELPVPNVADGEVLIKTQRSLVSLGTEKMLVEFGESGYLQKARQQPEKVQQVIDKIKSDGLVPTIESVFRKLDEPLPLGYSNAGKIIAVGEGINDLKIGDRVVSNGPHAEIVSVPKNLVAKIPDNVSFEEAAFTVVGSIGLQGIRLLKPEFGEVIVVIGLGLIGLITAELLTANGCRVIGFDLDTNKINLAKQKGIEAYKSSDPVQKVLTATNQIGADGVIITASTNSNDVISQSARMSRKRGRIILVGVIGLDINRAEFYEKELTFQVSCSYGPGRYDDSYEQKGQDYPLPFVRWTENRNFQTVLEAISSGKLDVKQLVTEVVEFEDYDQIYGNMSNGHSIASLLKYKKSDEELNRVVSIKENTFKQTNGFLAIVGAGNFTRMTLLPALKKSDPKIKYIVSNNGRSGTDLAKKYDIQNSTTDYEIVLNDPGVTAVLITTRHNLHAEMVIKALKAGKHVFVEKPLAIKSDELEDIIRVASETERTLTVGFNRRFSPHAQKIKKLLGSNPGPMNIVATMNAGYIPEDVWVHDPEVGGGRIIGEACHYIDLITFFNESKVSDVCMNAMGKNPNSNTDNASILLRYQNGSNGVINYFANGNKSYSKERVEVYSQGRTLILDNFRTLRGYGFNSFKKMKKRQDKGHRNQFELFVERLKNGGEPLIAFNEIVNTTAASFAAIESLHQHNWMKVD